MAEFPVKSKPPFNAQVLERWWDEAARQTDIATGRLRRWLGFMVLAGMLDTARHPTDNTSLFVVKGGVSPVRTSRRTC